MTLAVESQDSGLEGFWRAWTVVAWAMAGPGAPAPFTAPTGCPTKTSGRCHQLLRLAWSGKNWQTRSQLTSLHLRGQYCNGVLLTLIYFLVVAGGEDLQEKSSSYLLKYCKFL